MGLLAMAHLALYLVITEDAIVRITDEDKQTLPAALWDAVLKTLTQRGIIGNGAYLYNAMQVMGHLEACGSPELYQAVVVTNWDRQEPWHGSVLIDHIHKQHPQAAFVVLTSSVNTVTDFLSERYPDMMGIAQYKNPKVRLADLIAEGISALLQKYPPVSPATAPG